VILLLWACTGADSDPVDDPCADEPSASWESFGSGFVTQYCQTCHASTTPDRHGAPEEVVFDTAADVWARKAQVLEVTLSEPASMPPQGGVTDDDKAMLRAWLECGTEGE
jgi:uncharacterized membrane protein